MFKHVLLYVFRASLGLLALLLLSHHGDFLSAIAAGAGGRQSKGSSLRMGSLRKPSIVKKSTRRGAAAGPNRVDKERMRIRRWEDEEDEEDDFDDGPSVKDRLESLAKSGKSIASDVLRRAKVLRSSPFEALILKATWPDDMPVRYDLLEELVQHSIPAFKYARWSPDEDPYHMTLHKLWTKMAERDWRTVTKSLYILHCISRDSKAEVCKKFGTAMKTMSRARNVKNHRHYYFDPRVIGELNEAGRQFKAFVVSYAKYVLHRARMFSGRFDELRALKPSVEESRAVTVLKDVRDAIDKGLSCHLKDSSLENVIVCHALRLVATDVDELWREFGNKICPLVDGSATYNRKDNTTAARNSDIKDLLEYLETTGDKVKSFLSDTQKMCRRNRVKFSIDSSGGAVSMPSKDDIRNRIAELSGGYVADVACDMSMEESSECGPRRHPADNDDNGDDDEDDDAAYHSDDDDDDDDEEDEEEENAESGPEEDDEEGDETEEAVDDDADESDDDESADGIPDSSRDDDEGTDEDDDDDADAEEEKDDDDDAADEDESEQGAEKEEEEEESENAEDEDEEEAQGGAGDDSDDADAESGGDDEEEEGNDDDDEDEPEDESFDDDDFTDV